MRARFTGSRRWSNHSVNGTLPAAVVAYKLPQRYGAALPEFTDGLARVSTPYSFTRITPYPALANRRVALSGCDRVRRSGHGKHPVPAMIELPSDAALGSISTPLALAEGVTVRVSIGLPTLVSTIASPAKGSSGACPEVGCAAGDATRIVGGRAP